MRDLQEHQILDQGNLNEYSWNEFSKFRLGQQKSSELYL
jgi:hypothetical protein